MHHRHLYRRRLFVFHARADDTEDDDEIQISALLCTRTPLFTLDGNADKTSLSIHKNNRLFHRLVRGVNFIRRVQTRQSNLLWPLALAKPDETAAAVR